MIKLFESVVRNGPATASQRSAANGRGTARRVLKGAAGIVTLAATVVAGTAQAGGVTEVRARVVNVEPLYEQIEVAVPREVCRQENVALEPRYRRHGHRSATGPLLGAVIGGAIGNAVGSKKRNKQVGVAVGALLGGSIGADIARQRRAERAGDYPVRYRRETVCTVENDYRIEEQLNGYRVTYRYAGQTYETYTDYEPGDTIPVRVSITPLA
ncbi:MAG: glycine zipper 2TM domain-containing protein [Pseudomonadota bacterium]